MPTFCVTRLETKAEPYSYIVTTLSEKEAVYRGWPDAYAREIAAQIEDVSDVSDVTEFLTTIRQLTGCQFIIFRATGTIIKGQSESGDIPRINQ